MRPSPAARQSAFSVYPTSRHPSAYAVSAGGFLFGITGFRASIAFPHGGTGSHGSCRASGKPATRPKVGLKDRSRRSETPVSVPDAGEISGTVSVAFCKKGCFRSAKDLVIDMKSLHIVGGRRLNGTVRISGMKNAALPILFACALNSETCVLHNVPPVRDVETTVSILTQMGVEVRYLTPTTLEVNGAGFRPCTSPDRLVSSIRASSYLMGVELALCGRTRIACTGGCRLGSRPLDYHTRAFEQMGADMTIRNYISGVAENGLHPAKIMLDTASVGATVNIMLAASRIAGEETIILNAAREPHIVDLGKFLTSCGVGITGAGTSEIHIRGVQALHGCSHIIIPDMIEAGTYMAAVAGTGGEVKLVGAIAKHLESVVSKLTEMGVSVTVSEGETKEEDSVLTVVSDGHLKGVQIKTDVYPGFPTDMHPQFAPLLAVAEGASSVTENIWSGRFNYLAELQRMGVSYVHADSSNTATFNPGQHLTAASVTATDLRGGAAMVIAALMADGVSQISDAHIIERGYDNIIGKLRALGAGISCDPDDEEDGSLGIQAKSALSLISAMP